MSTLPQGWLSVSSGELFEFVTSGSRGWAKYHADEGAMFIRVGNLDHDTIRLDLDAVQLVRPPSGTEGLRTRLLPSDIVISITAELGMVALVPDTLGEAYINQHVALARPRKGSFAPYLAWFFAASGKQQLLEMRRGATKASLGLDDIRNVDVSLPPLPEQRRIVAKIEALQQRSRRAREALEAIPPLLDKFRQSVLAAAFRGDLTADWRAKHPDVEPASALLARIRTERRLTTQRKEPVRDRWAGKYEDLTDQACKTMPAVPRTWRWATLGSVVTRLTNGYVGPTRGIYQTDGVPYLLSKHVKNNVLRFDGKTFITQEFNNRNGKSILRAGDVLVVQTGHVGHSAVVPPEHAGHNCHAMIVISPEQGGLDGRYLSLFLESPAAQRAFSLIEKGMTLRHLNCHDVVRMVVPIPPLGEQHAVVQAADTLLARCEAVLEALDTASEGLGDLGNAALAKAFRGEFVPQDPNDEPAFVLLERIRAESASCNATKTRRGREPTRRRARAVGGDPVDESGPPEPRPSRPKVHAKAPAATIFLEAGLTDQLDAVHAALFAAGPLDRDDAVRLAANRLRDQGHVSFERLRQGGELYAAIDSTIAIGLKLGHFDRPHRGQVRAILTDPKSYTPAHWRAVLLASLDGTPTPRAEALQAAAHWAAENTALQFRRLRTDGTILTALKSALTTALRRGEIASAQRGAIARTT